jgi:hypothetical protein
MAEQPPLSREELTNYLGKATPGSQEYVTAKQLLDAMPPAPGTPGAPSPPTYSSETGIKPFGPPDINYQAPVADVRSSLAPLPEADRTAGLNKWADIQEQQQNAQGGPLRKLGDITRSIVQGTPAGNWPDRANAYVSSKLPESYGGRPYDEALALQQARNRRNLAEHPAETPILNTVGAVATAPLTALRGLGIGSLLGNVGIDTAASAVRGASQAPDLRDTGAVAKGAEQDAGMTLPFSLAANTLVRSLGPYTQAIPAIARAAEALGIKLPFFAQAESPAVQQAGRIYAQHNLSSPLNKAWTGANTATETKAADLANRAAGSTEVGLAPYAAGSTVNPALQGSIDAAQAEKGRLSDQITNLLPQSSGPSGQAPRFDFPGMRSTTDAMVRERVGMGKSPTQAEAGLGDQLRFSNRPPPTAQTQGPWGQAGGSTWQESAHHATDLGQRLGQSPILPREVDDARLGTIYAALRGDQRSIMQQQGSPGALSAFDANVAQQKAISDGQRALGDVMKDRPEAVINLVHNAATTKGSGTDINALNAVIGGLGAAERRVLGGGVLGKIVNDSGGSPAKIASALDAMPDSARAILFPPGTRLGSDVDNLLTVSRQVGNVNSLQAVGSHATVPKMDIKGYGGLGSATAATAGLGWLLGMPKTFGAIAGAGAGASELYKRTALPYLMQHGLSPQTSEAIAAATRGGARAVPQIFDATPFGRQR